MVATRFFLAASAALILTGSATMAFAQAKPHAVAPDFTVKNDFTSAASGVQYPQDDKRTLRWDAKKGRWGLSWIWISPLAAKWNSRTSRRAPISR